MNTKENEESEIIRGKRILLENGQNKGALFVENEELWKGEIRM